MQVQKKISPQGAENTHARPTHFSCPQVRNKYGRVHKTCPGPESILPNKKLDDGWPESVEEQGLLLLVWRHHITKQYIKDVL